jgi:hypothetical protein
VGNLNVVRVSRSRLGPQVKPLCEVLDEVLARERLAELSRELTVIAYDHEPEQFGDALSFGRFWYGYDLIAELTRTIHVVAAADAVGSPQAAAVERATAASAP